MLHPAAVIVTMLLHAAPDTGGDPRIIERSSPDLSFRLSAADRDPATSRGDEDSGLSALRSGGVYTVDESLAFVYGHTGYEADSGPRRPAISPGRDAPIPGAGAIASSLDMYDAAVRWDAVRLDPITLSVHSGVRALVYDARFDSPSAQAARSGVAMAPVVGLGARLDVAEGVSLSGAGSWRVGEDRVGEYLGLSAELAFDLARAADLSFGYERTHGRLSDGVIAAQLDRGLLFARIRLRF